MSRESVPATMHDDPVNKDQDVYSSRLFPSPAADAARPSRPRKFQHGFWDPEVAHLRRNYFKIVVPSVIIMILAMWLCLPVYWGSLGETSDHVPKLKGWVINRDNGPLGQAVVQAFEANSQGANVPKNAHLTWIVKDASDLPSNDDVINGVLDEKVWAAVVVNSAATQALVTARSTGDSSYNASTAVTFYYNQGRNEIAANSFIVPLTTALLQQTLAGFSAKFNAQYFASLASDPTGASPAIQAAAQAPQTVTMPFTFSSVNLRPFTKTVSTAVLLVGQIYITIFAFVITMAHDAARGMISPYLRFGSYAKLRLIVPLLAYIPLSFSYAMVNLPFKLTFGEKWGYGAGFFIFWLYVYMGMAALGLSTEAMITLLTPRFIAYFLLTLIIFNVSVASVPIVLQPGFYRYGYGFPVFNLSQAVRTIIFNTKSHLGLNAGVLIAWIILSCITIPLFTWWMRRKDVKAAAPGAGLEAGKTEKDTP